jgi:hypothetical protein
VLLWFAGLAWLLVWRVFRSPAVDYRLVVLGACLPTLDLLLERLDRQHAVTATGVVLALDMVVPRGSNIDKRQLLSIPIGMFAHLVLDTTWADTELFWWPVSGAALGTLEVPEVSWPFALVLVLELIGSVVLVGLWVRLGMTDRENRERFRRTGHLARDLA